MSAARANTGNSGPRDRYTLMLNLAGRVHNEMTKTNKNQQATVARNIHVASTHTYINVLILSCSKNSIGDNVEHSVSLCCQKAMHTNALNHLTTRLGIRAQYKQSLVAQPEVTFAHPWSWPPTRQLPSIQFSPPYRNTSLRSRDYQMALSQSAGCACGWVMHSYTDTQTCAYRYIYI